MGILAMAQAGEGFHRMVGEKYAHVLCGNPLPCLECFTQHHIRRSGVGQLYQVELCDGVIGDAVVAVPIALRAQALPLGIGWGEASLGLQRLPGCVLTLYAGGYEITGDSPLSRCPTVRVSAAEEQTCARCVPHPNAGG